LAITSNNVASSENFNTVDVKYADKWPRTHDFSRFVFGRLKQGELSVHEAVAQVAREHNAKLNTVFPRSGELRKGSRQSANSPTVS
jgi:hypothetical protein